MSKDLDALFTLQKAKTSYFTAILRERDWAKISVFAGFVLIAASLALGTYFFTKFALLFLESYPEFANTLLLYMLLAFFFLIFILTLGSSLISAIGILFVSDDDNFLLATPIKNIVVFVSRFINLLAIASWPVLIFGTPFLIAFNQSFSLGIINFALSFFALLIIVVISALAAALLAVKFTSIAGQNLKRKYKLLGLISLPFLAAWTIDMLIPSGLIESFQNLELAQIRQYLTSIPLNSSFLPSTWAVNFIINWQINSTLALTNYAKLLLLMLILSLLVYFLIKKEYFADLAKAKVGRFIAGEHDIVGKEKSVTKFPYFFKGIKGAFLKKDILVISRNQTEVLQAAFILFLILLYFLALAKVPRAHIEKALPGFSIIYLIRINFAVVSFVLSIFALRFLYPSISLEGHASWLIWPAPFSKAKIYWQKFITGWTVLSLVAILASIASSLILRLNLAFFASQVSILVATSLALTSINLGLGTLFPDFDEENAEKISTSKGGITSTFVSLVFILSIYLLGFSRAENLPFLTSANLYTWLLSAIIASLFSLAALKKINNYNF